MIKNDNRKHHLSNFNCFFTTVFQAPFCMNLLHLCVMLCFRVLAARSSLLFFFYYFVSSHHYCDIINFSEFPF